MLHLIKMWLDAPVEEDSGRGVPQAAPIALLLANLYMRRFVMGWKRRGLERKLRAKIVSCADDYVIGCQSSAEEALIEMRRMMERLKLGINEAKTHVRRLPEERFDFLGYTCGRCYSTKDGRAYLGTRASKKSVVRIIRTVRARTARRPTWQETDAAVFRPNRLASFEF